MKDYVTYRALLVLFVLYQAGRIVGKVIAALAGWP